MGSYIPIQKKRARTIDEALNDAERDHFLDCANADLLNRLGAHLLDAILLMIANSGFQHIGNAISVYLNTQISNSPLVGAVVILALKLGFVFLCFIWMVSHSGGTPAQQLLGLRVIQAKTGHYLSPLHSLARLIVWVFPVGWALVFFREDRRALHDIAAGSIVKTLRGPK